MRIKVEKTCKGQCLNICPNDVRVRVGSHYCQTICEHFFAKKIMNGQEEIICNFIEIEDDKNWIYTKIDNHFDSITDEEFAKKWKQEYECNFRPTKDEDNVK